MNYCKGCGYSLDTEKFCDNCLKDRAENIEVNADVSPLPKYVELSGWENLPVKIFVIKKEVLLSRKKAEIIRDQLIETIKKLDKESG